MWEMESNHKLVIIFFGKIHEENSKSKIETDSSNFGRISVVRPHANLMNRDQSNIKQGSLSTPYDTILKKLLYKVGTRSR